MSTLDAAIYNEVRGGKFLIPLTHIQVFSSMDWTAQSDCVVVVRGVGVGGGGANNTVGTSSGAATGGNSAPWGVKFVELKQSDVLTFTHGTPGAGAVTATTNGGTGTNTILLKNASAIMTIQPGEGGIAGAIGATSMATPAAATATVTGADYWRPGIQAGSAQRTTGGGFNCLTGGAAVDLLSNGKGRSLSLVQSANPPGGNVGVDGPNTFPWETLRDWGFVITDLALATATVGVPGFGGIAATRAPGPFSGAAPASTNNKAGIGGGGGAGVGGGTLAGAGGDAYFYVEVYKKT